VAGRSAASSLGCKWGGRRRESWRCLGGGCLRKTLSRNWVPSHSLHHTSSLLLLQPSQGALA